MSIIDYIEIEMDYLNNKDNIKSRMKILKSIGGIDTLLNLLKVNPKVGLDHYDEEDLI